ncbi:MAG: T9SS type A sorting domain-containing protein [Janthinobacterium lividum]
MRYFTSSPRTTGSLVVLLGLLSAASASQAQTTNTGTVNSTDGNAYNSGAFVNTSTGTFTNTGSTLYYAGPSAATFANDGAYTATNSATNPATDRFLGPNNAPGTQEISGATAPDFYNLTFDNGTGQLFTVSNTQGANVANTLTLNNGKTTTLNTVAGAIHMGSSASAVAGTLGATAGYVDGYMSKAGTTSFTYPLGAGNQNTTSPNDPTASGGTIYSPIRLSSPSATTLRYRASPAPSNTSFTAADMVPLTVVSNREYYPMGTAGAPSGSTITMPYTNFGPAGYVGSAGTLTIAAFNSTTGKWENLSNTATNPTAANAVTVTLNKTLSSTYTALALASTSQLNPLPVQLTAFTAVKRAADGLLSWTTASEVNSAYFEVQASTDGAKWQVLGQVKAAGTSSSPRSYSFLDKAIARYGSAVVYYRLNQVDQDGTSAFSPVRTLAPDALAWGVSAYPNPFAAELTAQLTTPEAGPVSLTLLDVMGRVVLRQELLAASGSQTISLAEARSLPAGAYLLLVSQHAYHATLRIVRR